MLNLSNAPLSSIDNLFCTPKNLLDSETDNLAIKSQVSELEGMQLVGLM